MTDSRLKVKSARVKQIFYSIDYNKQMQNTDLAKTWLNQHNSICISGCKPSGTSTVINDLYNENISVTIYTPKDAEIGSVDINDTWAKTSITERLRIINKFVAEIEGNAELICQVELLIRGILPKDTKKHGIKHIIEHLTYYSNWSFEFQTSIDILAAIISDDNSLATLGYVLALALASGFTLLLQTGPKISVSASLIKQLAVNAGVPSDAIVIAPGFVNPNSILSVPTYTVYVFDNLYSSKYTDLKIHSDTKIVTIANLKTSAIVFNNADLDSACKSIINAVWEYQGFLPWSVDTIFVQEDIFQNFVDKFTDALGRLHVGDGLEQPLDISCPASDYAVQKLQQMIATARSQGIEVHEFSQGNGFKPTVFVGGQVYRNNVIIENANDIPSATILPFRTANEALSLANNSRQGLGVSIWSQNVDLVNEVAQKLEVGNVWVNCHGIVKADVSFKPRKGSGLGYFGGPEGLYEFTDYASTIIPKGDNKSSPGVNDLVAAAKKAQQTWGKLTVLARIQKLSNWALEIDKKNCESELKPELWITSIYNSFKEFSRPGSSTCYDGKFYLRTHREPLGIVVLGTIKEDAAFVKAVIGALFLGNAVIIVTDDKNSKKFLLLPESLPIFFGKDSNFYDIINHKDVGAVIASSSLPRVNSLVGLKKIYGPLNDWSFVLRRATQTKNVWLTAGDSFT